MASKIDQSLSELIDSKRRNRGGGFAGQAWRGRGGRGGGFRGGRGSSVQSRLGYTTNNGLAATGAGGTAARPRVGDLRDVLAKKQKTNVTDLRSKLAPKGSSVRSSDAVDGRGRSALSRGVSLRSPIGGRSRMQEVDGARSSRRSDPGPIRSSAYRHKDPPVQLPSYAEAKKITVTVPGLSRPSEGEVSLWRLPSRCWVFVSL